MSLRARNSIRACSRVSADDEGKALIELSIVIGFLVLLALVAFDSYNAIRTHQHLSVASREAANSVFRKCASLPAGASLDNCILQSTNPITDFAEENGGVLKGFRMHVAVWQVNPRDIGAELKSTRSFNQGQSQYSAARVETLLSYEANLRGNLVIVESNHSITPLSQIFPSTFRKVVIF